MAITWEVQITPVDILWAKYQTQAARQSQIDNVIGNLETAASNNLEGRE